MKANKLIIIAAIAAMLLMLVGNVSADASVTHSITVYGTTSNRHVQASSGAIDNYTTAWNAESGWISTLYGSTILIGQRVDSGPKYNIYRAFLFFDTSSIPDDAVIISANLSLAEYQLYSSGAKVYNITIQNGQPDYPHDPVVAGDYSRLHYSGNLGTMNTSLFVSDNTYVNLTMNSEGVSAINIFGETKLAIRSDNDINGITPSGSEYIGIRSAAQTNKPKLIITYYETTPPTSETSLDSSSATTPAVNGTILHAVNWSANIGSLDCYIFSWNYNGTWSNDTELAFSGNTWSNVSKQVNAPVGTIVYWTIYANNTEGNCGQSQILSYEVQPPHGLISGYAQILPFIGAGFVIVMIFFAGAIIKRRDEGIPIQLIILPMMFMLALIILYYYFYYVGRYMGV